MNIHVKQKIISYRRSDGRKPLLVSGAIYAAVRKLAKDTHHYLGEMTDMLLSDALKQAKVVDKPKGRP